MEKRIVDANLNKVIEVCYEMLEIADRGDKFRDDAGCGAIYGLLRDSAYKVRRLAQQELEHHHYRQRVAKMAAVYTTEKEKEFAMTEKKKILVVDDEQDVLTYLTALFQDNGYETISATDGLDAFSLAKSSKPDLITLDITMPDQSGVRTYRQYKEDPELKAIPVIIVTGVGDNMRSYLKKVKGFPEPEGFMNKPIDPEQLLRMTSELIQG